MIWRYDRKVVFIGGRHARTSRITAATTSPGESDDGYDEDADQFRSSRRRNKLRSTGGRSRGLAGGLLPFGWISIVMRGAYSGPARFDPAQVTSLVSDRDGGLLRCRSRFPAAAHPLEKTAPRRHDHGLPGTIAAKDPGIYDSFARIHPEPRSERFP